MRWLLLPLGLAIAATAAFLLLAPPAEKPPAVGAGPAAPASPAPARSGAAAPARPAGASAPMGEIDDASRRALDRVLEREGIDR